MPDGAGWRVTDLGSRNGTKLNQQTVVGSVDLKSGDVVGIGDNNLALRKLANAEAGLRFHLVERIRFLRNVPLFKGLSAEDLMKLAEIFRFELAYQGRRVSTWLSFALLFAFAPSLVGLLSVPAAMEHEAGVAPSVAPHQVVHEGLFAIPGVGGRTAAGARGAAGAAGFRFWTIVR